ncbi:radical SAM family heme chaperone HemW [Gilvibacter sp.]|uniref:radical SAM family heme chaperone HemW n=1 Tax=Gilvibacter sp. TaxID=2729997 RepID=UPI0025BFB58A|nr:radical SAM family heme chaperone HemW [Gilvibacter sp.]NQX78213.1 radical SAM family heme chaperone HemW [Gilvibacter sp.]
MAGLYLHIPFCKQACHYCDFHFSTSLKHQEGMVAAMKAELILRKEELTDPIQTIYLGGGTPSLLTPAQLEELFETIQIHYQLSSAIEFTLEANPDDIDESLLIACKEIGVNRLSLGIQSFREQDLKFMNRAHNQQQAEQALNLVAEHFENYSVDLIYGVPDMPLDIWEQNLQIAFDAKVPHLSCYALTVEPDTALDRFIQKGVIAPVDEALAKAHYDLLLDMTSEAGYVNYEFSNFGKSGFQSQNNTAYWEGVPYLGIGPGAHSLVGHVRSWNISNNPLYIKGLQAGKRPHESEKLSLNDRYNEYIMTGLRTAKGVSLSRISEEFGAVYRQYAESLLPELQAKNWIFLDGDDLHVPRSSKFVSDAVAAELFKLL